MLETVKQAGDGNGWIVRLHKHGIVCDCGNRGCWETIGSIPGILRRYCLAGGSGTGTISFPQRLERARAGERTAERCNEVTLDYLESALTNVFNIYDPRMIVPGGKLFTYLEHELPTNSQECQRTRL